MSKELKVIKKVVIIKITNMKGNNFNSFETSVQKSFIWF